jgi:hypothetical protein
MLSPLSFMIPTPTETTHQWINTGILTAVGMVVTFVGIPLFRWVKGDVERGIKAEKTASDALDAAAKAQTAAESAATAAQAAKDAFQVHKEMTIKQTGDIVGAINALGSKLDVQNEKLVNHFAQDVKDFQDVNENVREVHRRVDTLLLEKGKPA